MQFLENRILEDNFGERNSANYDEYLHHLYEEDDREYEDKVFERLNEK